MIDLLKKIILFDAERDFYAKHFPSVREDDSILIFRPMKKSDISTAREIEKLVYNFPWSDLTFRECFRAGYSSWVFEKLGEVFAYGIIAVGAQEAHVMNLCVSPLKQKKGYGQKLMLKLMVVAREQGAEKMLLEVRPSNKHAIRLYKKLGFSEVGLRKDYYPAEGGREDALMLGVSMLTAF